MISGSARITAVDVDGRGFVNDVVEGVSSIHPSSAYDYKMGIMLDPRHHHAGCRTVQCEEAFQDFVIAHELLHLRVPNHGRLFKALLTTHIPNWRKLTIDR
jgi:hypothetical protein